LLDKTCSSALAHYSQRLGEIFIIFFLHHLVQKPAQLPDVFSNREFLEFDAREEFNFYFETLLRGENAE